MIINKKNIYNHKNDFEKLEKMNHYLYSHIIRDTLNMSSMISITFFIHSPDSFHISSICILRLLKK